MLVASFPILSALGCSTSKMAVGAMVPIIENSKEAALASDDIRTFKDASPSNLFLIEGLIRTDPKNDALRLSAAMLYFSYAFLIEEEDAVYASKLYLRGLDHGKASLL